MPTPTILIVRMGGGYIKAIVPGRQEIIYGMNEKELAGRLKNRGIPAPMSLSPRKTTK